MDRGVALDTITLNIRWQQKPLLPWHFAYAYVTSGLHTYFSDISIKHKKMETIPFSYAYAYAYGHSRFTLLVLTLMFMACAYAYVAV